MSIENETTAAPDATLNDGMISGRGRTKASQEKSWKSVLDVAKRFVAQRPDDHLSSLLSELRELNISRKDPGNFYTNKDVARALGESIMKAEGKPLGDKFYYPDVRNGKYTIGHISPIRYLSRLITPQTTGVMELGSGWSSNIFQLYIAHGKTRSRKLIYYGGEYTSEGQACAKYIAERESDMKYRAFRFDYRNPSVEFLVRQRGHILLFTTHSIEQVDVINPDLFAQLKQIPNPVTVVHFEPVGWQRDARLAEARASNDADLFEKIGARVLAGDITSQVENAAWWSWRLDYNTNLLPIVTDLEREGAIRMQRLEYDYNGQANVLNPSTLIHYEFVR